MRPQDGTEVRFFDALKEVSEELAFAGRWMPLTEENVAWTCMPTTFLSAPSALGRGTPAEP